MSRPLPPDETAELLPQPGALYAERFALGASLGEGGSGRVFLALDHATGREVALKRVGPLRPNDRLRVRRECAALAALDLPGVVRLIGHGFVREEAWIAMERARGGPFPAGDWATLERPTLALLSTLARVHEAGLVHRDVKPSNVLVDEEGRATLVDFGLAWGERLAEESGQTRHGVVVGTPRYMAPEQLADGELGPPVDLYALGVMLYEALTGTPPFPDALAGGPQDPRLHQRPTPLRLRAPRAPRAVCDLIDRLLSPAPEDRPSADEVTRALGGEPLPEPLALPWLGDPAWLDRLEAALRSGAPLTLGGPPGSGRSRALMELSERAPEARWLLPGERPFESLRHLVGLPPASLGRDEAEAWLRAQLDALDAPLLADDWAQLDPDSRALLGERPGLLRVVEGPAPWTPPALTAEDLRALFQGPDRVLHLREDAARELARRSDCNPARVRDQLRLWLREGALRRAEDGAPFRVRRERLQRWASEPTPAPPQTTPARLSAPERELLGWVYLCGERARPALLREAAGLPLWELEVLLARMESTGALQREGERLLPARARPHWGSDQLRQAQAALAQALPQGTSGRLQHMLAGGLTEGLGAQAQVEAARAEQRGELGEAASLLEAALPWAEDEAPLRADLVRLRLAERTRPALEHARFIAQASADRRLLALVKAATLTRTRKAAPCAEAEALLRAMGPLPEPKLEMQRLALLTEAFRAGPPEVEAAWLEGLADRPLIADDPERLSRWRTWMGSARYRQRRFAEAAALHERAAQRESLLGVLSSLANAASAWLEAVELERAEACAERLRGLAAEARHATFEARGEWALRSAANRRGATTPDADLVAALRATEQPFLLGLVALTEGFIARRGGDSRALPYAEEAAAALGQAGVSVARRYASALAAATGGPALSDADLQGLWAARHHHPDVVLDAGGLLASAGQGLPGEPQEWRALAEAAPEETWDVIRGALSVRAALQRVEAVLDGAK